MNIILNGSVFVKGEEVYFEDFEIEVEDLLFDDFEDEEDYCEGCYCCEDEDEFLDPLEERIEEYTELLSDECICPDCIRDILISFVHDLIDEE